jgi:voltage-dependent potassium channel beta subunit
MKVSQLGLGSWLTFGERYGLVEARKLMKLAFDLGVNLFDNAEVYASGLSEMIMGEVLREFKRSDVVVITKIFFGGTGPNDMGHSKKRLRDGMDNSLRRMQLDYVDIVFAHRHDTDTPVEETIAAMDLIIKQGKALYWGTSEWEKHEVEQAYRVAKQLNMTPPSVEQPQYNMFTRKKVERDFAPLVKKYGMGIMTWSPLASGFLTGKYQKKIPKDTRYTQHAEFRHMDWEKKKKKVDKLMKVADQLGCTMAQLAIAWAMKHSLVSSVLIGATTKQQLEENIGAVDFVEKLKPAVMKKIDGILRN